MSDCRWRARYEAQRGRRGDVPSVDAKLRTWGECTDQDALFGDEELLTPEIRQWRDSTDDS